MNHIKPNFSNCLTVIDYTFDDKQIEYKVEDPCIIEKIGTYIEHAKGRSSWNVPFYTIWPRWEVYNQIPYIESFIGTFSYESNKDISEHYRIGLVITEKLTYEVVLNGIVVENAREVIMDWLTKAITNFSEGEINRGSFKVGIEPPSTDRVLRIGNLLNEIWNIIWIDGRGVLPESMECETYWFMTDTLHLSQIIGKNYKLHFHCLCDDRFSSFEITIAEKLFSFDNRQPDRFPNQEDTQYCIDFLRGWIIKTKRAISHEELDDKWQMEYNEYTDYVQWLPREVLDDLKELI